MGRRDALPYFGGALFQGARYQHGDDRLFVFGGPAPASGFDHLLGDLLPGGGEQLRGRFLADEHLLGFGHSLPGWEGGARDNPRLDNRAIIANL